MWLPQIVKAFGLSNVEVGLVAAIPYAAAIATMMLWASYSDRSGDRLNHVALACGMGCLGMGLAAAVSGHPVWTMVCLSVAIAGVMAARPPFWTLPTEFLSGRKAAAGIAAINSIGNLGGFFGPTADRLRAGDNRQLHARADGVRVHAARLNPVHALAAPPGARTLSGSSRQAGGRPPRPRAGRFPTLFINQEEYTCVTYRIAAMGGDGIGPEVVDAGVKALKVCAERDGGFKLDFQDFDWGSDYYKKHGVMMPEDGADQLRGFDAILFGAVGAPDIPDHITLWGLRLAICQPLDQYANVRPTRILPGITSPLRHVSGPELDWVIVRENSEGEYSGVGGRAHRGCRSRWPRTSPS